MPSWLLGSLILAILVFATGTVILLLGGYSCG